MEELFSEYIGIIAFLLFLVFPRVFRWLITRGGRTPSPVEKTLEDLLKGEVKLPDVVPESVVKERVKELGRLQKRAETLLSAAAELVNLCEVRGGAVAKMGPIVESAAVTPLGALMKDLKRIQARKGPPNDYEVTERKVLVRRLKTVVGILDQLVQQRIQPAKAALLGILDIAAKDCLLPYLAHAQRIGAPYSTKFALSVIDQAGQNSAAALEASAVAGAVTESSLAEVPRRWVSAVSDISMDVYYSTKGLSQKLFQSVGAMPAPVSVPHNANTSTAVAGLIGAALPRIFGDVGAALYLGPGAPSGLAACLGRGSEEERAITWQLGKSQGEEIPMHLRMFAMCRTLYYSGFDADAERIWEAWKQRLGNPSSMTLIDASGKKTAATTALLLQGILRAVDSIAAAPVAGLGNIPLTKVPGIRCTQADFSRMQKITTDLSGGIPINAPSRIIIGAALLAAEKSPTTERRIGTAALKSIAGKGIETQTFAASLSASTGSVFDAAASPTALMQAVALGAAFSPRRGR